MELKNKEFREHTSGLFVSSDGEVFVPRNGGRYKEHFTYGCDRGNGYLVVVRNRKIYQVHRLVAECFLDNPENLPTVDHINRDKTDNNVSNLRWADYSLQAVNRDTTYPKKVLQLTLDGELVREWPSISECGSNDYHYGAVSDCCRGKRKTHKGYIWRYA